MVDYHSDVVEVGGSNPSSRTNIFNMTDSAALALKKWLGPDGISFFKHLKGLTGEYSPVLSLNVEKRGIPTHPIHFREGHQIRNWMRGQDEFKDWDSEKLDDNWVLLVEKACNLED